MNRLLKYGFVLAGLFVTVSACENEGEVPVLKGSDTFVDPAILNSPAAGPVELLPENATQEFEEFTWNKADYGINLPVNYVLEAAGSNDFLTIEVLATTASTYASVTVEDMNDAALALGFPGFVEGTVSLRVKAVVTGADMDTLYSEPISRTIMPYQLSDCGNYCTIGIIGSATPGGWGTDTDMRLADPARIDKYTWTVTLRLVPGEVKFRASNGWDINWGASDFPSGTGAQNGPNIPIAAEGYYKVVFDDKTGNYTFTQLSTPVFTTIGIIGSATPGGWDADTDLTKDANDPHVWTGSVTLTEAEAKFRAENDWANNWGEATYPSGYGIANGPNIPVKAGTYTVYFNDASGEYMFMNDATKYTTIGIIGSATANGWDSDQDMTSNPTNPYKWSTTIFLSDGEVKFRAENDWANNWGSTTFPQGIGIKNGPNITVKSATYVVEFNSGTGEYYLIK